MTRLMVEAQDLLLKCAVLKQGIEPLKESKMFNVWARRWVNFFNETIEFCVTTIRVERENER